jgi:hypothetical protein
MENHIAEIIHGAGGRGKVVADILERQAAC